MEIIFLFPYRQQLKRALLVFSLQHRDQICCCGSWTSREHMNRVPCPHMRGELGTQVWLAPHLRRSEMGQHVLSLGVALTTSQHCLHCLAAAGVAEKTQPGVTSLTLPEVHPAVIKRE